jgi:hypothetical protein
VRKILVVSSFSVAAFLVGLWLGGSASVPAPAAALPDPGLAHAPRAEVDPEFVRSMERLGASVDALQRSLATRSAESDRREIAPANSPAPAPDLAALVERLELASARIAQSVSTLPAQPEALASPRDPATTPRTLACLDLFRELDTFETSKPAPGDARAGEQWKQSYGAAIKHWEDSHKGWTLAQVCERYGAPDALQADGEGPSYVYSTSAADGSTEKFVFQSRHGLIYDVDVYLVKP